MTLRTKVVLFTVLIAFGSLAVVVVADQNAGAGKGKPSSKPSPAPVPQTGQTTCCNELGIEIPCAGSGLDGEFQKGVALPTPRFTDHATGTITDNLTGPVWLKNANGSYVYALDEGYVIWPTALAYVAEPNSTGTMNGINCGDTSAAGGVHQTDWRLPNVWELFSLMHFGCVVVGQPTMISNAAGPGCGTSSDPFSDFAAVNGKSLSYWSSDSSMWRTNNAYVVDFSSGYVHEQNKNGDPYGVGYSFVIAVRGGR